LTFIDNGYIHYRYVCLANAGAVADGALTRGRVALGPGTLYGTIKRLLDAGLIEERAAAPRDDRDDPRRRYYRITSTGRRVLADETSALAHVVQAARVKRVL
jgi:DNA-binding PadR family transcriptional regulator